MDKKMDIKEISISFGRLIRLSFKNYKKILISFILGSFLAYIFTISPFIDKGTYIAKGSVTHTTTNSQVILNTIVQAITSTELSEIVALRFQEDEVNIIDDNLITAEITAETIRLGLIATTVPDSLRIDISFTYPDENLSIIILNEIIDQSISYANNKFSVLGNNVVLDEYAFTSTFIGPLVNIYVLLGGLFGLIISSFLIIMFNLLNGTIYSVEDLREIGISSFYLPMKIKKQLTLNHLMSKFGLGKKINFESEHTKLIIQGLVASSSFTTIQNNLESIRIKPDEPLTTLIVTPLKSYSLMMVAYAYARQSSTQGRKTILIDFDLKDVPFTKYLEKFHIETKKKSSTKEGVTFLSLEENLDLYLPLQDIIPAKVIREEETQEIINHIKKKYDHVIVLGPSLLPDSSFVSILSYVNSALIIGDSSKSTTYNFIQSINLLIDNKITAIETLICEEIVHTSIPSFSEIQSWFKFKEKQKPIPHALSKQSKKK